MRIMNPQDWYYHRDAETQRERSKPSVSLLADFDAIDMRGVMMRQFAGPEKSPGDLQEPEAHQIGAERDAGVDDPARQLQIGRDLVGAHQFEDEFAAHRADDEGEQRAAEPGLLPRGSPVARHALTPVG